MVRKNDKNNISTSNTLIWIPEKSFFIDYEIKDNRVKFCYSICFINQSEHDTKFSLSAKFDRKELKKWIKYEPFFIGYDEFGKMNISEIKSGETKNIKFFFEGEFAGGTVNAELSFPRELIIMA